MTAAGAAGAAEAEEASAGAEGAAGAFGAADEEAEGEVVSEAGGDQGGSAAARGPRGRPLAASWPCRWRVPVWRQPGSWSGREERKPVREECAGGTSSA